VLSFGNLDVKIPASAVYSGKLQTIVIFCPFFKRLYSCYTAEAPQLKVPCAREIQSLGPIVQISQSRND
jgi:hypothetical protein